MPFFAATTVVSIAQRRKLQPPDGEVTEQIALRIRCVADRALGEFATESWVSGAGRFTNVIHKG